MCGTYPSFLELESLILAQNERWRQVLGMQVKRSDQSIFCKEKLIGQAVAHG